MADLKQCTTSIADEQVDNDKPTSPQLQRQCKETTIALTSHTNTQLIKRQKSGGENNGVNGKMRKKCLKEGGGG